MHEFSHNIMGALRVAEPGARQGSRGRLRRGEGEEPLVTGRRYAINTVAEYWAEGTQWWFWSNIEFYDRTTKARVQTPDEFKEYDPTLYAILERVYPGHHIPADIYYGKNLKPVKKTRVTQK